MHFLYPLGPLIWVRFISRTYIYIYLRFSTWNAFKFNFGRQVLHLMSKNQELPDTSAFRLALNAGLPTSRWLLHVFAISSSHQVRSISAVITKTRHNTRTLQGRYRLVQQKEKNVCLTTGTPALGCGMMSLAMSQETVLVVSSHAMSNHLERLIYSTHHQPL